MHLPNFLRTSSFRLTILYTGLFGLSVTILFAVVYWSSAGLMSRQIDETVENELSEVRADAGNSNLQQYREIVTNFIAHSPGFFYLLQDSKGAKLAGNMPPFVNPPAPGLSEPVFTDVAGPSGSVIGVRGQGSKVVNGAYLFVGLRNVELKKMRHDIVRAFLLGTSAVVLFALLGGVFMSLAILRRVEMISRTSREIMAGDLGQRIAVHNTDDEFDRLGASLNSMLDRIQALMSGLQQVSSDVAHDLRTPLTRLRHRLEFARQRESTVDVLHRSLDGAIGDVDGILDAFGAVLRITQIESGSRKAKFARVNLSELLEGLVETYRTVADEKGQILRGDIEPSLSLEGDHELLTQLFSNLIENAINHCPPLTRITVRGSAKADAIRTVVVDSGPGIPEEFRPKIFQRFFRMDISRSTPGNGLGLSLVAAVADLHEASITLGDNHPGLSITVSFSMNK